MITNELKLIIGEIPEGDIPAAWYFSTEDGVVGGYDAYIGANRNWNSAYKTLLEHAGLPATTRFMTKAGKYLEGLVPDGEKLPKGFRKDKGGLWVPRKRTTAEKESRLLELWDICYAIPQPEAFIPGIPTAVYQDNRIVRVHFRKPAMAVLAFMAVDPDRATEPFEPGPAWSRLKMSTYHALREEQKAAAAS